MSATADLGIASPNPPTAAEATTQLEALKANPEFSAKYLRGDGPAVRQFNDLLAIKSGADVLDRVVDGTIEAPMIETVTDGQISISKQLTVAATLKELGIERGAVKQVLSGDGVSAEEFAAAQALKADLMGDPDFVKRYLAGSRAEVRKMTLVGIVLSNGIREKAA